MTQPPPPATPDVMALLCVIARAMRGVEAVALGMRLLLIGAICPGFGGVLRSWMEVEEHVARAPASDDPWWGLDADDGAVGSGWISRTGAVWRWRQVTRSGARVMLVRWFAEMSWPDGRRRGRVWVQGWRVSPVVGWFVFPGEMEATRKRVAFVSYC